MESKLKAAAMESVGELPAGYLHLPTTPIKQEPQLTDWISGDLKPVRPGVYQRLYDKVDKDFYCKFEDGVWYMPCTEIDSAAFETEVAVMQNLPWRGLSYNPNEVQS
jgi:hypothetical protein